MIFGRKKKKNAEAAKAATNPAEAAPPRHAPKIAEKLERIEAPQAATRTSSEALPPEVGPSQDAPQSNPERDARITEARAQLHQAFGKIALAAISQTRYRNLTINDMTTLFLEPLLNNRIAIASPADNDGAPIVDAVSAIAIWASVSPEVDRKIREQINAGTYPVRLQREDWNSGTINWLIDIIAPSQRLTAAVIANFRQVLTEGEICIHPMVMQTIDREVLEKIGARPIGEPAAT